MDTDVSKNETNRVVALLKLLLPGKRRSFFGNAFRMALIFGIIMGFLGVIASIEKALDKRTPEQKHTEAAASARQQRVRDYQVLLKDFPCVKLDDEPVAIQLEWLGDEVKFAAPKTYTFTGARFSEQTIVLSKSKLLAAEEYDNHLFVPVPVKKRSGYSPDMYTSSVYISIPKRLVPEDFRPRFSAETTSEPKAPR